MRPSTTSAAATRTALATDGVRGIPVPTAPRWDAAAQVAERAARQAVAAWTHARSPRQDWASLDHAARQ